ncbi:MAG: hypothetical protein V3U17_06335 [Thermoplasmata archaeon]
MSARTRKSVVRSIRITKELDDLIRQVAKNAGGSVNALISSILTKYAEWDRYADRFGFVTVPRDIFRSLINAVDEEKLADLAEGFGPAKAREMVLLWFKRVNPETQLRWLSFQMRYGRLGNYEIETGKDEDTIALHHDLGVKFSLLLSRGIEQVFESIPNISPQLSVEENALAIRFPPGTLERSLVAQG